MGVADLGSVARWVVLVPDGRRSRCAGCAGVQPVPQLFDLGCAEFGVDGECLFQVAAFGDGITAPASRGGGQHMDARLFTAGARRVMVPRAWPRAPAASAGRCAPVPAPSTSGGTVTHENLRTRHHGRKPAQHDQ